MSPAFTKTFSLLILIFVGYFLQKKIRSKEQLDGIRTIILSLALPATIWIALLQINFESSLLVIPIMSLGFNIVVYLLMDRLPLHSVFNISTSQYRTLIMLIPSLAPGLSCFPFIIEYSGQSALAMAALADVGNKIFVLIISYTIAMRWYFEVNGAAATQGKMKGKEILSAIVKEPVNVVILVALAMLAFGLTSRSFPEAVSLSIDRISLLMTPLVLLFIGLSMRLTWAQAKTIFSFLFFRSGVAFAVSGLVLFFFPVSDLPTMLLIVVFPQSACSFWPYAHMASVTQLERNLPKEHQQSTFDLDFAMNVLACSLPFSVVLIVAVYAGGTFFTRPAPVLAGAGIFVAASVVMALLSNRIWNYKTESLKMSPKMD